MLKRICTLLLAALLMTGIACAEARLVPDSLIAEAVLTQTWNTDALWWTEGHIVLGEKDLGDAVEVYIVGQTSGFAMTDGVFLAKSGMNAPMTIVAEKTANGFRLRELRLPESGEGYAASVRAMMPAKCAEPALSNVFTDALTSQTMTKARAYLLSIGSNAQAMDYGEYYAMLDGGTVQQPVRHVALTLNSRNALYVQSSQVGNRVHLRTKPQSYSYSLGKYYTGTPVLRLDDGENGYVHVRIGYMEGYMDEEFLYAGGTERASELMISHVTSDDGYAPVYQWNDKDSAIVDALPSGAEVIILGVDDIWCHVVYGSNVHGFILKDQLSPAP